MRVYVPLTVDRLRDIESSSSVGPAPFEAAAVTAARRSDETASDDEQLEFDATFDAARRSLELLAQDPAAAYRRLVVAADVPDGDVSPAAARGWVVVAGAIPLSRVAAFLVDGPDAMSDVSTAALTMAFDALDDVPLQWFAVGELSTLVAEADA